MTAIILGFLGASPFGGENPSFWGLEKLGFPWILSAETRLINGLRGIFGEKLFRDPRLAREAGTRDCRGDSAGRGCS
ncbi:MAG: hypothetical protein WAN05_09870 [Roseiarcus sp.]